MAGLRIAGIRKGFGAIASRGWSDPAFAWTPAVCMMFVGWPGGRA